MAIGEKKRFEPKCTIWFTVQYYHEKCIVHADSKAVNLLLDADVDIKIADFVFSKKFTFAKKLNTFCGQLS